MQSKQKNNAARWKLAVLLTPLLGLLLMMPTLALADSKVLEFHNMLGDNVDIEAGIWGQVIRYTGRSITLENGNRYDFDHNVLVDVETLNPNERGNVRIFLNDSGKAIRVLFHGIDMPDVFRRYGN